MTEDQVRIIVRDEMARIMAPVGTGDVEPDKPKVLTSEDKFIEILMAASTSNFSQLVDSCETQGLIDDLVNSDVKLTFEQHKKMSYVYQATSDRRDTSRFGMVPSRSIHVIGVAIREFAADAYCAKAGRLAEETQAAKLPPVTQNGMTRNEVFAEENERQTLYGDANLRPLERNLWAYRR